MKIHEKIELIKKADFNLFVETHQKVKNELSEKQPMFCCCGKLATGLHEDHCSVFKKKVITEVIRQLEYLIPQN